MNQSPSKSLDQATLDSIAGWLSREAQVFTQILIDFQRGRGFVAGILELGVFKGKYLSLLSYCIEDLAVPVVGVDAFLQRVGQKLSPEHKRIAELAIHDAIASITGSPSRATLIDAFTRDLRLSEVAALAPSGYTFISVDAGHDAEDVVTDLAITEQLLHKDGIAAVDDVYNAVTPGVAEGFFKYFQSNPDSDLAPFAACGNKVFLSRRNQQATYFQKSIETAEVAEDSIPALRQTSAHLLRNRANNWVPHLLKYPIVPFLGL